MIVNETFAPYTTSRYMKNSGSIECYYTIKVRENNYASVEMKNLSTEGKDILYHAIINKEVLPNNIFKGIVMNSKNTIGRKNSCIKYYKLLMEECYYEESPYKYFKDSHDILLFSLYSYVAENMPDNKYNEINNIYEAVHNLCTINSKFEKFEVQNFLNEGKLPIIPPKPPIIEF